MKRAKRILAAALFAGVMAMPAPALAFHHSAVPADECAPAAAGQNAGNNPTATEQQQTKNPQFDRPLPPAGKPGDAATPSECPAP